MYLKCLVTRINDIKISRNWSGQVVNFGLDTCCFLATLFVGIGSQMIQGTYHEL